MPPRTYRGSIWPVSIHLNFWSRHLHGYLRAQFGAFSPLFRLHGHRGGKSAPPSNQCGPTNGDNEVWNLAKDPEHYAAIEKVTTTFGRRTLLLRFPRPRAALLPAAG